MENINDIKDVIRQLFKEHFAEDATGIIPLPPSGSNRQYFRVYSEKKHAIGVYNELKSENNSFFYFTRLFLRYDIPVGELYAQNKDQTIYLVEDLGDRNLLELLKEQGYTEEVKALYKKSLQYLARLQWKAGKEVDYSLCYDKKVFDFYAIISDLNYFRYYFADILKVDYNKAVLQEELLEWARRLSDIRPQTFMYRDFQGRNIQVKDGMPFFIDYQGGMLGIPQYDLVSLLWQAKAQLPESWKNELLAWYIQVLKEDIRLPNFDESIFRKIYLECILLRILQTLGAYGFRGLIEKKPHFLTSISPALKQLSQFLEAYPHFPDMPELRKVLRQLTDADTVRKFSKPAAFKGQSLTVSIYSFSYRKGLPVDVTGNGGGFVFDCRGILNPGRIDAYKSLTGMDKPVQQFLMEQTVMPRFLEHVYETVDLTIENYLERGFDFLSVCFGCTGGQHRSVFAALSFAEHVNRKFGLQVHLQHLEQGAAEVVRR